MLQLFSPDDVHQFKPVLAEIEESPVSPLSRVTFWLVVLTFVFFVVWSIFGQIDIVVSAEGRVIPDGHVKIVQPLETGIVRKINVSEGSYVKKGQVLMEIDPSATAPEAAALYQNWHHAKLEMQRIGNTLNSAVTAGQDSNFDGNTVMGDAGSVKTRTGNKDAAGTQAELYQSSMQGLIKLLASKKAELARVEEEIKATEIDRAENEALLQSAIERESRLRQVLDIIAKDEYVKVENDILSYRDKATQAEHKLSGLAHQKNQLLASIEQTQHDFKTDNLKDLAEKQKQATELEAQFRQSSFKNAKQVIVAPVDGYVDYLWVHTIGGVVTPAEKLLSIVPANIPLVIKADVTNKDIGFVEPNMKAQIKVHTFDFQKYGMFDGQVKLVSRDSHEREIDKQHVFDVYLKPLTPYIMVDGKKQPLTAGMTVTAEIKTGKRRIIEFFIYPIIKYMHEGMSVR